MNLERTVKIVKKFLDFSQNYNGFQPNQQAQLTAEFDILKESAKTALKELIASLGGGCVDGTGGAVSIEDVNEIVEKAVSRITAVIENELVSKKEIASEIAPFLLKSEFAVFMKQFNGLCSSVKELEDAMTAPAKPVKVSIKQPVTEQPTKKTQSLI